MEMTKAGREPLMDVAEAAVFLGLSPWTVRAHVRDRVLPFVRIGRRVLFEPESLRQVVERGRQAGHAVAASN